MVQHAGPERSIDVCAAFVTLSRAWGPSSQRQVCIYLTPADRTTGSERQEFERGCDVRLCHLPVTLKANGDLLGHHGGRVLSQAESQHLHLCPSARITDLNVFHQMSRFLHLLLLAFIIT